MPEDLVVRRGLVIPGSELRESASRASGPGGQHVNKTSTRVTLRWSPGRSAALGTIQRARLLERLPLTREGELVVHAGATRSRARNRERARERLAERVRDALSVRRGRRPTRPTRASREKRLEHKRRRAGVKRGRSRVRSEDA